MQQIRNVWANLDKRKQIFVGAAVLAMFLGILVISRIAATPNMKLLFAGLENGAAGQIVSDLDQRGVQYEIRGDSIFVPADMRDQLRMALAGEGLPANGGRGYELLDSLNGFGTTSQMFDAAYWRAKEGELARTIVSGPHVRQARVHIANQSSNPFQRSATPTASVSVVPATGQVTPAQANAIRYLVASAVSGLTLENVAVIDSRGNVIGANESKPGATQDDRAQQLRLKVMRLLEARVGPGNAIVELSLETVKDTETIRERRLDPDARVAISTDVEERSDASKNQSANVTVASNLPDGEGGAGDESNSTTSSTRERVNYEISETELEIVRAPGAIKRLTVAVLVNGSSVINENGEPVFEARPEQELSDLRDLVQSAVGFDAERGDQITIKSMDLPVQETIGTAASMSFWQSLNLDAMSLLQLMTVAVVTLILGLFVVRPIMANNKTQLPMLAPALAPGSEMAMSGKPLSGEIYTETSGSFQPNQGTELVAKQGQPNLPALPNKSSQETMDRLRTLIGDKQEESVEILRGWLSESEEKT